MKNKFIIITAVLFSLMLGTSCYAKEYVVKLNDSFTLFSVRDNQADKFITVDESEIRDYIDAGIVEYYEPNADGSLIEGVLSENTRQSTQEITGVTNLWNHLNVKAQFPLYIGAHGTRVKIAVIDTGVNEYSCLKGKVLEGYNYHTGTTDVTDTDGHGTFVSSLIASSAHSFAYRSYIVPLKVFYDSGKKDENGKPIQTVKSNDVAQAIRDAVDKFDCDVINMSLTLNASYENLNHVEEAIEYAIGKGAIIVAAVGNEGTTKAYYPAAYENVIGVGSVNEENEHSLFSQTNSSVFVVAPGEDVLTSYGETDEEGNVLSRMISGTSMSAPHVSALAAVAKCIKPSITNDEFMQLISSTAENLGDDNGYDEKFGHGIINCEKVVRELIKDRKIYISPVVVQDGYSAVWIYNNTSDNLSFRFLYTSDNHDTSLPVKTGQVPAEQFAKEQRGFMNFPYDGGSVKYMAWDSFENLIPLAVSSEYIAQ